MIARRYGASGWHLAGHVAYLALAAYVLAQLLDRPAAANIVAWLVAAIVLHDLVALPLYTLLDRLLWRAAPRRLAAALRTAAVLAGFSLLVFFPPVLGLNGRTFARVAGHPPSGYAARWIALAAGVTLLCLGAAALRRRRDRARQVQLRAACPLASPRCRWLPRWLSRRPRRRARAARRSGSSPR
jgi:hypothetical protein